MIVKCSPVMFSHRHREGCGLDSSRTRKLLDEYDGERLQQGKQGAYKEVMGNIGLGN